MIYVPAMRSTSNGEGQNTLRLSFSAPTPERIEAGVARLASPSAPNRQHWRQRPQLEARQHPKRLQRRIPAARPATRSSRHRRSGGSVEDQRPEHAADRLKLGIGQVRQPRHAAICAKGTDRLFDGRPERGQLPLVRQASRDGDDVHAAGISRTSGPTPGIVSPAARSRRSGRPSRSNSIASSGAVAGTKTHVAGDANTPAIGRRRSGVCPALVAVRAIERADDVVERGEIARARRPPRCGP